MGAKKRKRKKKSEPVVEKLPTLCIDASQGLVDTWYLNGFVPVAAEHIQATLEDRYLIETELGDIEFQLEHLEITGFVTKNRSRKKLFYTPTEKLLNNPRIYSAEQR